MQISRLFQMIYILLERGTVTAPELAKRFEVSVRTIYRDMEALSQAGIPIYASQGKGGGISLNEKFILNKSLLSEKEQDEILLALQSLSAVQYPELDEVLSKLSSLFFKSKANWIEVEFSPWGSDQKQKEAFSLLKNAILEQKIIAFSYFNGDGEKSNRLVEPMKLLFKDKAWYLKGYCLHRMSFRTFKITRMSEVRITGDSCFHLPSQEQFSAAVLAEAPVTLPLQLKIAAEGAYRVYDDFCEKDITKHQDGSYTVNTSLPVGEWIFNYLFSFGSLLEVIEPQWIRSEMANRIRDMANKYHIET
ncbi:helix-turn-helix transcriptional regulator [Clostridium aminobutyricum]|uniref:YafY family transcriptional regulator n=1 Tax=Clostridium aminobutyricum TaxID=33953 RepID=A0A939IJ03_CLOAM|nr:YafY family protein [Clostridium aminobutyricum]MBN7773606.1 YafY family transcriptional regulator [Clostridium aminobutyricum]